MTNPNKNPNNPEINHSDYALPRVSKELGESLYADAAEMGGLDPFITQAEERLSTNNPDLYMAIGQFAHGLGLESSEAIGAAHKVMVVTHELLRRQAETDSFNAAIGAPNTPEPPVE